MKIYIVANSNLTSGGSESLHQLFDLFKKNNFETYMYYCDNNPIVPQKFRKYNIEMVSKVDDSSDNIIIVPEIYSAFLREFKNIKKIIWWLSWSYYLSESANGISKNLLKKYGLPTFFYPVVKILGKITKGFGKYPYFCFNDPIDLKDEKLLNFYNSKFVKDNLSKLGVKTSEKGYVCCPINDSFFGNSEIQSLQNKENIIAYNPAKGIKNTNFLIGKAKELNLEYKFVPLINMSPEEVNQTLKKAKIYIDFGTFPGPERIPREAVMQNCLILTSKNGAANNNFDVPIPNKYKFKDIYSEYQTIFLIIRQFMDNPEKYIHEYDEYRNFVISQRKVFESNALNIIYETEEKKL